ncbi:MAG TPA: error-prone DNA polymerase, partial [Myxococcota bacterium]|nr:error-prone DNA polymerase [Myxococcota bacterium]
MRDRLYAMCARHHGAEERAAEARLCAEAGRLRVPIVAAHEVLYHAVGRRPLQDILTCIRHGVPLAAAGARLRANAEHGLKAPHAFAKLFADQPTWVTRTHEVAERCQFNLASLRYRYPSEALPKGATEQSYLRSLTLAGARKRYGDDVPEEVLSQIDKELDIIAELDYGGYFLTMWEIVQFCRRSNILCQGRGSAANSAVCYCLEITAVDPIRMDLLFERFVSRERAEPPDIDMDIEHNRREEVIQWVYGRYGRRHAAMVANFIRFRLRSAVREVGKALGLPLNTVDRLAKVTGSYDAAMDPAALATVGLDPEAPVHQHLCRLVPEILDFPRHLSIHPGGFLLGHEPVDTLVPIEPASMEDRTVIQWDKQDIEDLGLFKVDLLGLGALSQVHACFDLVAQTEGITHTMATVPAEDSATYAMISRGDTVGLFQIESRAQMSMLPRLKPSTFYDLVVEVAIVRPGPIQGDMVHPYLRRRGEIEPVEYPHPIFERVLKKTYGVPIFQEQVMKLAVLAADYTPGEADQLRRDMAAWRSTGRIERHHARIVGRMVERGVPQEFAERIFKQIRGFGEYGFPESHAASFALIAYVTAYLKRHHHAAFTCALLNAQPMGFYSPSTIVEDGVRHGVTVLPIDVNHSGWDCQLVASPHGRTEGAWAVRMGLRYVRGLGEVERGKLTAAPPPYASVQDFVVRTGLSQRSLVTLAQAGAFTSLGEGRRDTVWAIRGAVPARGDALTMPGRAPKKPQQGSLFAPLSPGEAVLWDYRTSFHSARGHPMKCVRQALAGRGIGDSQALNAMPNEARVRYVGLVICRQRPQTASGVTFLTLEDEVGFVNLVVWKNVYDQQALL